MNNFFEPSGTIDGRMPKVSAVANPEFAIEDIADPDSSTRIKQKTDRGIFRFLYVIVLVCFGVLIARTAYLKTAKHEFYQGLAEGNRHRIVDIPALRGIMYDRNGTPLVRNIPATDAVLVPVDLPSKETDRSVAIAKAAEILHMPVDAVQQVLDKRKQSKDTFEPALIKENLTRDEAIVLEMAKLPGFIVQDTAQRNYLESIYLSHILGYTGRLTHEEYVAQQGQNPGRYLFNDYIGKTGIESTFEDALKGKNGQQQVEADALGHVTKILASTPAKPGNDLILTIDLPAQKKLTDLLEAERQVAKVPTAAAVAMNPQNGEVIALVSLPNFDLNEFAHGITPDEYQRLLHDASQPLYDKAIGGSYPPGSTFKPYVASAALQEGIITPSTTVQSTGKISIGGFNFLGYKAGGHGSTNLNKAIAQSVNTYFYYIGGGFNGFQGLGIERIHDYALRFGFDKPTGIDLPGEASGLIPNEAWKVAAKGEQWYIGDTYHAAIGQGDVAVTPIQLATAFSAIANGGTLYRPHLVTAEKSADGEVKNIAPEVVRKDFLSPTTVSEMHDALQETVRTGSGRSLLTLPVTAAGKTGTAQYVIPHSNGTLGEHSWFTVYAPAENPQIVVVVLLPGAGEGHLHAVPVAKDFLQWYFTR